MTYRHPASLTGRALLTAADAAAARAAIGAAAATGGSNAFSATIGNGSLTSIPVTHNLGTLDVVVSVFRLSDGKEVDCDVVKTSGNIVTLVFATAPASNSLRCTVIGTAFGNGSPAPVSSTGITDATDTGRSLITTANAAAARGTLKVAPVLYYIDNYGADPTGTAFSDSAVAAALSAMGTSPGSLVFGTGTYKLSSTVTLGPYQSVVGDGRSATILKYTGSTDCIRMRDPNAYVSALQYFPGGVGGPRWAGRIQHLSINGTDSGTNACAIHVGDITRPIIDNVNIWNFEGAGAKGIWFDNRVSWTEKSLVEASIMYCTEGVVFEDNADYSGVPEGTYPWGESFAYSDFKFHFGQKANQSGVRITRAQVYNCNLTILGGFFNNSGSSSNSGTVLAVTEKGIYSGSAQITIEASGDEGKLGHKTITVDPLSRIYANGTFLFAQGSIPFQDGTGHNGNVVLTGLIDIDDAFGRRGGFTNALRSIGSITGSPGYLQGSTGNWYPFFGNWVFTQFSPGALTITVNYPNLQAVTASQFKQGGTWDLFLKQPASGGNTTLTWPGSFVWASGSAPTLSTTANAVDWIRVSTTDFVTFYAHHVNQSVVTPTGTQTLTNKTLTSPKLDKIYDTNGNLTLDFQAIASAVNYVRFINAAAGGGPRIVTLGNDTHIGLSVFTKGTGSFLVRQEAGNSALIVNPVLNNVNQVSITSAVTGANPKLEATGTDTNVSLNLVSKGTGTVQANSVDVVTTTGTQTLSGKTYISASASTATAAGTTTLTSTSAPVQVFTGTTTHTVKLPSTSVTAGMQYTVVNQSTGNVTVQSSAANTITTMTGGAAATAKIFVALQDTPTADTHWRAI